MRDPRLRATAIVAAIAAVLVGLLFVGPLRGGTAVPSFVDQACGLPRDWLVRVQRGFYGPRSGEISILPRTPAYMTHAGGGWTHSGPWPYVQDIPLVFYGPGVIPARGDLQRPVTLADVAPTFATFLRGSFQTPDGASLDEVVTLQEALGRRPPKLIVTVVWDGGGWNALHEHPEEWPNLARLMQEGISFSKATVGSSPSVTPAVHTTLGAGVFPWRHGVPLIKVKDEQGRIVDAFLRGESSRFIVAPTIAERWDEQNDNQALVGMVGYEPWHLGMIGRGAEKAGGDKDHAVWLNVETNEWVTNPDHYALPRNFEEREGLEDLLDELDAADGRVDKAWGRHEILDDPARIEETPAFIRHHGLEMMDLIADEGYGDDDITDFLYTNFKQIDRVGHYFNMASDEVGESVRVSDEVLGELVRFLDEDIGRGNYVVVVTADHGMQPDASTIGGFGIDPAELQRDIHREFGEVTKMISATEIFVDEAAMEEREVTLEDIARFVGDYRLRHSTKRLDMYLGGTGEFKPNDRLFDLAIPSHLLFELPCGAPGPPVVPPNR